MLNSAFNIKRGFVMFVNGLMMHVQYCMTKYSVAYYIECICQQNSYMSIKIQGCFRTISHYRVIVSHEFSSHGHCHIANIKDQGGKPRQT